MGVLEKGVGMGFFFFKTAFIGILIKANSGAC